MKKMKHIFTVTLLMLTMLLIMSSVALASETDDFIVDNGVLTSYTGTSSLVTIPSNLGITAIGDNAFYENKNLTKVIIPTGVTSIGNNAFSTCTSLTSVTIPDTVTLIAGYAFYGCTSLNTATVPSSVTEVGDAVFTETAIAKPILVNKGQTLCYVPTSVTSYTIPDTVTTIAGGAFFYCENLTSITIPSKVTSVGSSAFAETGITKPILINNGQTLCYVPNTVTSYTIPTTVTEITGGAFFDCNLLTSITIPDNICFIEASTFAYCSLLKSAKLPENIMYIDNYAFYECKRLHSINIPQNVSYIGSYAFYNCYNLASITFPDAIERIDDYAFTNCTSLKEISIPANTVYIGDYAFSGCDTLENITTFYNIDYIGENAFPYDVNFDATPAKSSVLINSKAVKFEAYNMDGSNYFKLRDLAKALNGTQCQFSVAWDSQNNALMLTSNEAYTPIGGELKISGNTSKTKAILASSGIYLDGSKVYITAYKINGSNYFKLRDLAEALGFDLTFDSAKNTIKIDTSKSYTAEG